MSTGNKNKIIPLCIPEIRGREWQYIKECLDTNWVSSVGRFVTDFEHAIADRIKVKQAVACSSGTAALHTALLVAGIGADEEVILPALTFVAPANAIRYVGAWPTFIDVQADTWQLDPQKLADFVKHECDYRSGKLINRHTGRCVSAIMPVHIMGHPVDMDPIIAVAKKYGLVVIEDATESLGAKYKGKPVGSLGDIACFSFNGNKIITTGGGGMIVTNNKQWADKSRYLATQAKDNEVEYIHNEVGFNYRLNNVQAAMGLAQLELLDNYIAAKINIAAEYQKGLSSLAGLTLPRAATWADSIYWLYTILINKSEFGLNSRELLANLQASGIQSRPFWHPVHSLKPYQDCYAYNIEQADRLYEEGLSLPSSVGLTEDDQNKVIEIIRTIRKQ